MLRILGKSATIKRTFMASAVKSNKPVLFNVQDTARIITLNRSNKLNALNTEMCESMFRILNEYAKSDCAHLIVLKSANQPRSFCAGGDVASVALNNKNGDFSESIKFFTSEYSLNFQMATYTKPIVTIMDGITMGGGVGLSIHTPFRIATGNTKWAMPEMDIGFFPDVGTTFAMPRIITMANRNSQMALYLALTGDVISGRDAYILGLASHYVEHEHLANLQSRLAEIKPTEDSSNDSESFFAIVNSAIEEFTTPFPQDYTFRFSKDQLNVIESCFDIKKLLSVKSLLHHLDQIISGTIVSNEESKSFANEIKTKLLTKSKTSLQIALRLLQENSKDNIESALKRDLYTAANMCVGTSKDSTSPVEFSEATIHKLVNKEKSPYPWKFKLEDLSSSQLTSLISPKPSMPVSIWKNYANVTWKHYPHHLKYQLPTEDEIMRYITGQDGSGDSLAMNGNELIKHYTNYNPLTRGKPGVDTLCKLVIDRKCSTKDSNTLIWNN